MVVVRVARRRRAEALREEEGYLYRRVVHMYAHMRPSRRMPTTNDGWTKSMGARTQTKRSVSPAPLASSRHPLPGDTADTVRASTALLCPASSRTTQSRIHVSFASSILAVSVVSGSISVPSCPLLRPSPWCRAAGGAAYAPSHLCALPRVVLLPSCSPILLDAALRINCPSQI